jgi:hypothetical protein
MSKKYGTIDIEGWRIEANRADDGFLNVYVSSTDGSRGLMQETAETKTGKVHIRFVSLHVLQTMDDDAVPRFRVEEFSMGFAVADLVTGLSHWLSDGVDVLFDEDDNAISPGTEGFCEAWAATFNAEPWVTMDVYWPLLFHADGYEWPSQHMRWVVVLADARRVAVSWDYVTTQWEVPEGSPGNSAIPFMDLPKAVQKAVAELVYE